MLLCGYAAICSGFGDAEVLQGLSLKSTGCKLFFVLQTLDVRVSTVVGNINKHSTSISSALANSFIALFE